MQIKNFDDGTEDNELANALLDTIKYTAVHINDPDTPGYIKALLV